MSQLAASRIYLCFQIWLPRDGTNSHGMPSCMVYYFTIKEHVSSIVYTFISCSPESSVASAEDAEDGVAQAFQTIGKCSQSRFRSVSELSSGGDRSSGLATVDMVYTLCGSFQKYLSLKFDMNKSPLLFIG